MPKDLTVETCQFSLPSFTVGVSEGAATILSNGEVTEVDNAGNSFTFMSQALMDIQGWTTMEENTFYPTSVALQRGGQYAMSPIVGQTIANDDTIKDLVFILPRELTDAEQAQIIAGAYPAFINGIPTIPATDASGGSSIDKQQVLWGQWAFISTDTVLTPIAVPRDGGSFGTGEPTLANRLWVYRFVRYDYDKSNLLSIPPFNGILDGAFGKETDLEYMERLRRTFVLASDLR